MLCGMEGRCVVWVNMLYSSVVDTSLFCHGLCIRELLSVSLWCTVGVSVLSVVTVGRVVQWS